MKRLILTAAIFGFALCAQAHDLPLSYVDLHVGPEGIDATIESSAKNFTRALPGLEEARLLDPTSLEQEKTALLAQMTADLTITSAGQSARATLEKMEPLPARRDLRLTLHFSGLRRGEALRVQSNLFAAQPRHRTFLNIYEGEALKYQGIFDQKTTVISYDPAGEQKVLTVVRQFLGEGIHHIFIGPDHILFIVGLLLLGGSMGELLRIVTAFTIAHSITLVLATLNILTPPARFIEPAIALSIVFVGAHALIQGRGGRDWRLLFAFCFGFIHGFGFANVLREMALPRAALGWSLFSFNVGVEIGQACIVLAVAPFLAWAYRRSERMAGRLVAASSFAVVLSGSYWFVERLFPMP